MAYQLAKPDSNPGFKTRLLPWPNVGCGVGADVGVGPGEGREVGAFDGGSVGDGVGKPKHLHSTGALVGYSQKEIEDKSYEERSEYNTKSILMVNYKDDKE